MCFDESHRVLNECLCKWQNVSCIGERFVKIQYVDGEIASLCWKCITKLFGAFIFYSQQ